VFTQSDRRQKLLKFWHKVLKNVCNPCGISGRTAYKLSRLWRWPIKCIPQEVLQLSKGTWVPSALSLDTVCLLLTHIIFVALVIVAGELSHSLASCMYQQCHCWGLLSWWLLAAVMYGWWSDRMVWEIPVMFRQGGLKTTSSTHSLADKKQNSLKVQCNNCPRNYFLLKDGDGFFFGHSLCPFCTLFGHSMLAADT